MGIKIVVAVTDNGWFDALRRQPSLSEINFWSPNPKNFRALRPGELFLFKLRAPRHAIAGGGVFTHSNTLPCSLAWESFGTANGADSLPEMRERILAYRKDKGDRRVDFKIGCRILTQPFFFAERDWIHVPKSFTPNIVSLKSYSTDDAEGFQLWKSVIDRFSRQGQIDQGRPEGRYGRPQIIRPRLGQGAFRVMVTDIYARKCAVTGERTLPALEAAHIRPYGAGGRHELENGLLLRRDIHRLFDTGYVTITPDMDFEVSGRIREEFENGRDYYALHGRRIATPRRPHPRPNPKYLAWHNENCFL